MVSLFTISQVEMFLSALVGERAISEQEYLEVIRILEQHINKGE